MRINKFLAQHTSLSRRKADSEIEQGNVTINGSPASKGDVVTDTDEVKLRNEAIVPTITKVVTILLNKPVGYICSKNGQGSPTVYDLLPEKYHHLNIAGRLDKDSSGLVVLTNDGDLLNDLTHPSNKKVKIYEVITDKPLTEDQLRTLQTGVDIGDKRLSHFENIENNGVNKYKIFLREGRNRQIRRSLDALGSKVLELHRTKIGKFSLPEQADFIVL